MRVLKAVSGLALLAALAGCERTSYSDERPTLAPANLNAQPIGGVQSGDLSAPSGLSGNAELGPGQFPDAPQSATGQQVASVGGATAAPPANSLDVTKEQMLGNWNVSSGGSTCAMFLTLTKFGTSWRGGTRQCAGELSVLRAWDASGKQVTLMDSNGNTIGHLFKVGENNFTGSTASGVAITVSR